MNNINYLIISIILVSCFHNSKKNEVRGESLSEVKPIINQVNIPKKDSIEIQNLIRKVYKWNASTKYYYFNIGIEHKTEPRYIGIDWLTYDKIKRELIKTQYFTTEFIENYKNILVLIDKKVKSGIYEWNQGELPPFGTGANEWCHCQDHPDNYWENMIINTIKLKNNIAEVTWNWGKEVELNWIEEFKNGYPLIVSKESGIWKISYMDGFDKKYY